MKLSIGIVGLPNVGKSTLFKLLTKQEVNVANYPFATIDPNVGIVPVPDERLQKIGALYPDKKLVPAVVEFYDIAGLVKGAHKGGGLGNQFLAHIRETQAIVIVIRLFGNSDIVHVENSVNPVRDLEIVNSELALKDLETVEKRLHGIESDVKAGKKGAAEEKEKLIAIKNLLETGRPIVENPEIYSSVLKSAGIGNLNLLTAKKQIYLLNGREENIPVGLTGRIKEAGGGYVAADLVEGDADLKGLIKRAYRALGLITFFTIGDEEVRAWTVEEGTRTPQAAGAIHSDFEKNFIRTEVVGWDELVGVGGWNAARQKGKMRTEGKGYIVGDGDVVTVRHG